MCRLQLILTLYTELGVSVPYWNNVVCVGITKHLGNEHLGQTNMWFPPCTAFFLQLTLLCLFWGGSALEGHVGVAISSSHGQRKGHFLSYSARRAFPFSCSWSVLWTPFLKTELQAPCPPVIFLGGFALVMVMQRGQLPRIWLPLTDPIESSGGPVVLQNWLCLRWGLADGSQWLVSICQGRGCKGWSLWGWREVAGRGTYS